MTDESVSQAISKLDSSPMYKLSRGSQERFHTAFLALLSELYPAEMSKVWSSLLGEEIQIVASTRSSQEKQNMDLWVPITGESPRSGEGRGPCLVIENKFRSMHDKNQLDKYARKCIPGDILLALGTDPQFFVVESGRLAYRARDRNGKPMGWVWTFAHYFSVDGDSSSTTLLHEIRTHVLPRAKKDKEEGVQVGGHSAEYAYSLVRDYLDMIDSLASVVRSFSSEIRKPEVTLGRLDRIASEHDAAGIRDLLKKMFARTLAQRIEGKIAERYRSTSGKWAEYDHLSLGHGMAARSRKGVVDIYTAISSNQDKPEERVTAGIQIEGTEYRHFIVGPFGNTPKSHELAGIVRNDALWFTPKLSVERVTASQKGGADLVEGPTKKTSIPGYCTYADRRGPEWRFLYRYVDLSSLTIDQVVECVSQDLGLLWERRAKINDIWR